MTRKIDARVLATRVLPKEPMRLLEDRVSDLVVWKGPGPVPREFLLERAGDRQGLLSLLTDRVDGELLVAAPDLRVVSNYAVGYDNIDVDACTGRGVIVTNTPGVLTDATADLAFALILASARRIVEADRFLRAGNWTTWDPELMVGSAVGGRTLGVVGMGQIGEAVARRGRGFDMEILYTDRAPVPRAEEGIGAAYLPLDRLLAESDIVSLHVPLTRATRGLLGRRELGLMRPGAILVNTSRGEIVDDDALVWALTCGPLGGAGLDVFSREPLPSGHPLVGLSNTVLTPHIGSATSRARTDMGMLAVQNLLDGLAGRRPEHMVNPEAWGRTGGSGGGSQEGQDQGV